MAMCLLPATKDGVKLLNLNRILAKLGLWKIHGPYFLGNTQEGLLQINIKNPDPTYQLKESIKNNS